MLPPRFGRFVRFEEQDETTPDEPEFLEEEEKAYWYSANELKNMKNIYLVEVCAFSTAPPRPFQNEHPPPHNHNHNTLSLS